MLSTQKYWPYGAVRSGSLSQTDKLYTGQQVESGDSALGLYNYKARFYSTVVGRFASADGWTGDGLNRYAYTRNNPLRYDDPTGHGAVGIPGPGCVEDTPGDGSCDPAPAIDPLEWANTVPAPSPIVPGPDSCPTVDEGSDGHAAVAGVGAVALGVAVASPLPVADEAAVVTVLGGVYCLQTNCGEKLYDATRDLVHKGLGTLFGKRDRGSTERNPAQDKRLTDDDIKRLKERRIDPENLKGNNAGYDLFKDRQGNIYVKPRSGVGPGDPTGVNIND